MALGAALLPGAADAGSATSPSPAEDTSPKVKPRHGEPGTDFKLSLTARHDLGVHGESRSDYRVAISGPREGCGLSFQIGHGAAGTRIHRRLAHPGGAGWCLGSYKGTVSYETGPYCPPQPGHACPLFVVQGVPAGRFSFRVEPAKGTVEGEVRECNTPTTCATNDFTVSAYDGAGRLAGSTHTDHNHYKLRLLPGSYSLVARSDGGLKCDGSAMVQPHRTTHADITCLVP
ncbi:MAG: hypothetical protein JOZ25_07825 [Actinobacteria bacterium]|nr:hypothetical protein [Actinomycetota bacterium]